MPAIHHQHTWTMPTAPGHQCLYLVPRKQEWLLYHMRIPRPKHKRMLPKDFSYILLKQKKKRETLSQGGAHGTWEQAGQGPGLEAAAVWLTWQLS